MHCLSSDIYNNLIEYILMNQTENKKSFITLKLKNKSEN